MITDDIVMSEEEREMLRVLACRLPSKVFTDQRSPMNREEFFLLCQRHRTVYRAFRNDLIIPNWARFAAAVRG